MEGGNGGVILPLTLTKEVPHGSNKVDHHLKQLLASRLSSPDLTPQEIAEASKSAAAAAAIAAKVARAKADEKAAAAAKAVAAAKTALDLIASFPNPTHNNNNNNVVAAVAAADLLYQELPSKLQLGDVMIERQEDFNAKELVVSDRLIEAAAKEGIQVTRKRGRPKLK
ncbi:unnamed protein product [Microthlaspi erraticum]|uniref:Uncharacterized protein n=1 Tax=Microthlaspi erraticum TaxID=1685480 RepID=A0A6D2KJE7_9BRAS|nr:unnamed protein product [Microthlaspi erraticum]